MSRLGEESLRTLVLPGTAIETTALGFGCADLFRVPSKSDRRRLLDCAFEHGIRHFDVARMYGLGAAERELGRFARGRRDRIVIATKFGIRPSALAVQVARVQGPMRSLFQAFPSLRQRARTHAAGPRSGRAGALVYAQQAYDAASARASLETSLAELGTDYVDLFLLHEPEPEDPRTEELSAYLEEAREAGRIRAWGVSGEPGPSVSVTRSFPRPAQVIQIRDDVFLRSLSRLPSGMPAARVSFGPLSNSLPLILAHVNGDAARRERWSDAVGVDCGDRHACAALLIRDALRENPSGTVLFTTIRVDKIRSTVAAAGETLDDGAALDAFIGLVQSELQGALPVPGGER
jgi:D-threo-aldose 1-dehydrogenase